MEDSDNDDYLYDEDYYRYSSEEEEHEEKPKSIAEAIQRLEKETKPKTYRDLLLEDQDREYEESLRLDEEKERQSLMEMEKIKRTEELIKRKILSFKERIHESKKRINSLDYDEGDLTLKVSYLENEKIIKVNRNIYGIELYDIIRKKFDILYRNFDLLFLPNTIIRKNRKLSDFINKPSRLLVKLI